MRIWDFSRSAFGICAAAAMLAGCGGSQPPIGAQSAMPQSPSITTHAQRGGSWMLPEAKSEDLIYTGREPIYVLSFPALKLVGTIDTRAGLGICSNKNGDVFMTYPPGEIVEYAHGGTQPIATLYLPGFYETWGCGVDPTSGDLAVALGGSGIAIFPDARGSARVYPGSGPDFIFCGYDNLGNLFVDGFPISDGSFQLAELRKGHSALANISLDRYIKQPGQVQWDGKYVTVQDRSRFGGVYRVKVSGSVATVVGTTKFEEKGPKQESWIQDHSVVSSYRKNWKSTNLIGVWKYPAGGEVIKSVSVDPVPGAFLGLTISVAPQP